MSIKIVATADNHLDPKVENFGSKRAARRRDFKQSFEFIVDYALEKKPDIFLQGGDLFHSIKPGNIARAWVMEQFRRLSEVGIQVVVVSGHHDTPKGVSTGASPLRTHGHSGHVIFLENPTSPQSHTMKIDGRTVQVTGIGSNPTLHPDEDPLDIDIPAALGDVNILLMHHPVLGFRGFMGDEAKVDPKKIPDGYQLAVTGHFHSAQHKVIGGTTIIYPGSSDRIDYREEKGEKSFSWIEIDDSNVISVKHISIPTRTMRTVSITVSNGDDINKIVMERMAEIQDSELICRFQIAGAISTDTLSNYRRSVLLRHGDGLFFKTFIEEDFEIEGIGRLEPVMGTKPDEELMNHFGNLLKNTSKKAEQKVIKSAQKLCLKMLEEVRRE
ncbi:MAG: exonuclease SbcCD subunit D [Candidatus Thorarchaeota archaeon]